MENPDLWYIYWYVHCTVQYDGGGGSDEDDAKLEGDYYDKMGLMTKHG